MTRVIYEGASADGALSTETADLSSETADLTRQIAQLQQERDYLLLHSQNLEAELRRIRREPARIHELERMLADAEARLGHVSVISVGAWLILRPHRALRRMYRRFRESGPWRMLRRFPALDRMLRRFRA